MTKILYFARMRQILGKGEEDIAIPGDVTTVSMLIDFPKKRDDAYASAFADQRLDSRLDHGRKHRIRRVSHGFGEPIDDLSLVPRVWPGEVQPRDDVALEFVTTKGPENVMSTTRILDESPVEIFVAAPHHETA